MGTYGKTSLREKSWEVCLKKGDRNTSFFHERTRKKKKKNTQYQGLMGWGLSNFLESLIGAREVAP